MADISNLIGKLNNSNEEVIDQLNENNEHVSRTNNLIQNLSKVLTGNDLQEAEDKRELNSLLKKLSEGKGDGKPVSSAGVTPDDGGGGGGLLSFLGGGLLTGAIGVIGTIIKILGAESPLATATKMLKESKIGKTFLEIYRRLIRFFGKDGKIAKIFKTISGFFGKEGGAKKLLDTIKSAKGPFLKGLKFLGRLFGRIFGIFVAVTAFRDATAAFNETEGDFTTKLSEALKVFGASVLDAIFGWIPTLAGHILEFFGAPEWLTDMLKEFDLKAEIKLLVDTLSIMLEDAILFFMDGSFTKMFTEDIPNSIEEFFGKLRDWFTVNVTDPVKKFIDNNETIQKIKEKSDILIKMLKAIPDKVSNFFDKITSPVKGIKDFFGFGGDDEIDGSALPLPNKPKEQQGPSDILGLNIDPNVTRRNLRNAALSPAAAPVILPVTAAGPSETGGGSGTVINVNNGSDSSIRDAQRRATQGAPSIFGFYSIPQ